MRPGPEAILGGGATHGPRNTSLCIAASCSVDQPAPCYTLLRNCAPGLSTAAGWSDLASKANWLPLTFVSSIQFAMTNRRPYIGNVEAHIPELSWYVNARVLANGLPPGLGSKLAAIEGLQIDCTKNFL